MKVNNTISNTYITFLIYSLIGWVYEVLWMWFVVPPKHFINRGVLIGPFLPIYGFGMLILLTILKKFMVSRHELSKTIYLIISVSTLVTVIYTTVVEYVHRPKILNVIEYLQNFGISLLIINVICIGSIYLITKYTNNKKIKQLDATIVLVFLTIWIITTLIEYISHLVMDRCFSMILWDYTNDFLNINARVNWDASRNFAIGGTLLLYAVQPHINRLLLKLSSLTKNIVTLIIGTIMILDFILHVILHII